MIMRADTTPAGSRDLPAIWDATCARISDLVRELSDDAVAVAVPTVPGATVRDVLELLEAIGTQAVERPADLLREPFALPSAGPVDNGATWGEVAVEWEKAVAAFQGRADSAPELACVLITYAVMSEHDLRTALGMTGSRDDVAVKVALDELSGRFSDRVASANLPPLRVTVEQWGTIIGDGRAVACVVADRFEFVRAMSGRRSAAEIRRWNWGVEPDVYLPVISEVGLPTEEIRERDPRIPEHMRDREFVL